MRDRTGREHLLGVRQRGDRDWTMAQEAVPWLTKGH